MLTILKVCLLVKKRICVFTEYQHICVHVNLNKLVKISSHINDYDLQLTEGK